MEVALVIQSKYLHQESKLFQLCLILMLQTISKISALLYIWKLIDIIVVKPNCFLLKSSIHAKLPLHMFNFH